MHRGSCLCGAVRFEVAGSLPPPDACHCADMVEMSFFLGRREDMDTLVDVRTTQRAADPGGTS